MAATSAAMTSETTSSHAPTNSDGVAAAAIVASLTAMI
jgi:hypothetical protein